MEYGACGQNFLYAIELVVMEITPERGYVIVRRTNIVENHVQDLIQMI